MVKAEKIPMLAGGILIILLAFLIVWKADILGVSESRLEEDAREKQNIKSSWEAVKDVNEDICAMLFFDEDKSEYTYSVYLSRDGMSYGYFFAEGGSDNHMEKGVKGIAFENNGIALLSLNPDKVCRIVIENDIGERAILVDPEEPFAVVLPSDCEEIIMFDAQNNIVTLYDTDAEE